MQPFFCTIFGYVPVMTMEEQKQQLVTTALEKFKKYGIRSVSIEDICREIGMSKKTFYQYFQGKEELVAEVLQEMNRCVRHNAEEYVKGKTALECVKTVRNLHYDISDIHKEPAFSYDLRKYYPRLYKEHIHNVHKNTKEILMQHLQQGINEGVYRADLDIEMCAVMYSIIQQAFVRNEDEIQSISPKRLVRFTMESFFRSIISEKGIKEAKEILNII